MYCEGLENDESAVRERRIALTRAALVTELSRGMSGTLDAIRPAWRNGEGRVKFDDSVGMVIDNSTGAGAELVLPEEVWRW